VDRAPAHDVAARNRYDGVRLRILQLAHSKCSSAVGPARRSLDTVSRRPEISGHPFIARSHGFEPNSGTRGRMDCLLHRSVAPLFWLITAKVRRTAKPHLEHIQVDI
jgi:hypothetical protein